MIVRISNGMAIRPLYYSWKTCHICVLALRSFARRNVQTVTLVIRRLFSPHFDFLKSRRFNHFPQVWNYRHGHTYIQYKAWFAYVYVNTYRNLHAGFICSGLDQQIVENIPIDTSESASEFLCNLSYFRNKNIVQIENTHLHI